MAQVFNLIGKNKIVGSLASILVTEMPQSGNTITALTPSGATKQLNWYSDSRPNPAWRGLPSGYTQLEFLKSTGTQHINTGLAITAKNWIDADISFDAYYSSYTFMIGRWASLSIGTKGYNLVFGSGASESNPDSHTITLGTKYNYKFGQRHSVQDGVELWSTTSYDNTATSDTIYLFSNNYQWVSSVYSNGKIYSCKIYDGTFSDVNNSTLLGDYVPCKNSSNVYGMYDLVSNTFLTNVGSGTFTPGNEVPQYITTQGFLLDNLNEYGTYHLTATDGSRTATTDCVIDLATRYIIPLLYQIILTENNINTYFDVSNGSYYFNGSNGKWTATNLGVHSTTASSTWTSKGNYNIIMDYQVISESNYDKMSLTIAGIAILSQASGSQSGTTSQIAISTGQAVSLTFTKDVSVSASGETANISNVILSA